MENDFPFRYSLCSSQLILQDPEVRLNASSFPPKWIEAKKILEKLKRKITIERLSTFAEKVFVGARVKRLFVGEKEGIPYLMPDDVFMFPLKPRKWVRKETQDIENWWVEPFTILITQSGAAGRCLIVNKHFKGKLVSPNMIRVVPNSRGKEIIGFIYAFLNSSIGQTFLLKEQYGITVKHIEPDHVSNIPIPMLPESDIREINEKILEAHKLREEAQELLSKAEGTFYKELNLPEIKEDELGYCRDEKERSVKTFIIKSTELELRLDASFYNPISKKIREIFSKIDKNIKIVKLSEVAKIFDLPTYKRIYTSKERGKPTLSGSQLNMIKLFDLKYLSPLSFLRNGKNYMHEYEIKEGWILIAERGTIGISCYVSKFFDGWLASHNILRTIPSTIHPGYLITFLLSSYGRLQMQPKRLGGVVEVLDPKDLNDILVPIPPESIQAKIGNLTIEAYEKKDQANLIENEAIKLLENKLEELAR